METTGDLRPPQVISLSELFVAWELDTERLDWKSGLEEGCVY